MCEAIRYGDTTICGPCGMQWDTNDPEPPACRRTRPQGRRVVVDMAPPTGPAPRDPGDVRLPTTLAHIPTDLPANVAASMAISFDNAMRGNRGDQVAGMRAAYRVFLDWLE